MSILPIIQADAQRIPLADETVQCVVTSPPYFNLRSYKGPETIFGGQSDCEHTWEETEGAPAVVGTKTPKQVTNQGSYVPQGEAHTCTRCQAWRGKLGREASLQAFIENLVSVFREVRRVLHPTGCLFIVIGDSFAGSMKGMSGGVDYGGPKQRTNTGGIGVDSPDWKATGLAHKNKLMVPWRLGLALQADGWILRQDNIWHVSNKMPTSAKDRTTVAHEYVLHLVKEGRYYYDAEAVQEPTTAPYRTYRNSTRHKTAALAEQGNRTTAGLHDGRAHYGKPGARNLRSVWRVPTEQYSGTHYATFPRELARRCIKAASRPGDVVLDPFVGSGTTLEVAYELRRVGIGLDISWEYCSKHAMKRFLAGVAKGRQEVMVL